MSKVPVPSELADCWILSLGAPSNAHYLMNALVRSGFRITPRARMMMEQSSFTLSLGKKIIRLAALSVQDLGFEHGAEYRHICAQAVAALRLSLCPGEVGPLFRKSYANQPRGGLIYVAMTPIVMPNSERGIFIVGRDAGGPMLGADEVYLDDFYAASDQFLFLVPDNRIHR